MTGRDTYQAGFTLIMALVALVAVGVIAGTAVMVLGRNKTTDNAATAPTEKSPAKEQVVPSEKPAEPASKTYENSKYNLSFSYPADWRAEERDPATSSLEYDQIELSVWLLDAAAKTQAEAAVVTVSSKSLQTVIADIDSTVGGHDKEGKDYRSKESVNGKEFVKYVIPQPGNVVREWYLMAHGSKTVRVETFNEKENITRHPGYMSDIKKIVDSLKLQ